MSIGATGIWRGRPTWRARRDRKSQTMRSEPITPTEGLILDGKLLSPARRHWMRRRIRLDRKRERHLQPLRPAKPTTPPVQATIGNHQVRRSQLPQPPTKVLRVLLAQAQLPR